MRWFAALCNRVAEKVERPWIVAGMLPLTTQLQPDIQTVDLRSRRLALGFSVARVAALSGFSPAHITQLEEGYRPKRGNAVSQIIKALEHAEREAAP